MTTYKHLGFEVRDQVATLTLNNPSARNALSADMRLEIEDAMTRIRKDDQVRAVILTGAEGHFCAGGDIRNMSTSPRDAATWRQGMSRLHDNLMPLMTLDRPLIAAVDGVAYGAGFSFALMADFVLATPRARFCMSFLRIGLVPDCAAFHNLPRIVGVQRAKELMLSAREVKADEALQLGIVMELHAPEQLMARAHALGASMAHASPVAVSLIKRALATVGGADLPGLLEMEATAQGVAGSTDAHRQAVQRFLNKEPAAFQWPNKV